MRAIQSTTRVSESKARGLHKLRASAAGVLGALTLAATIGGPVQAAEFKLSDEAGVTAGLGLRTSFAVTENGAASGVDNSNDFVLDNTRLFFSGHYGKIIKGTLNFDRYGGGANADGLRVMDSYVGFEFNDLFNVWMGRFLPPQDRANGYGPFYSLAWSYPGTVSNFPQIENGRDNGIAVWGKPFGGKLTYAVGAFEGHNKDIAGSSAAFTDKLAFSGRLVYHIWDPEPAPAYLSGGWFGGSKDLLSIGIGGYTQKDGVGSVATHGNLNVWNADLLFEKKFSLGVPTVELGYYKYDLGAVDCGSAEPGSPVGCTSTGQVMEDGKAGLISAGFLFPQKVGWGQFQPYVRYQKFDRTLSSTTAKTTDYGLNYIIKGPNAKVVAQYSKLEDERAATDFWKFIVGVQLIY